MPNKISTGSLYKIQLKIPHSPTVVLIRKFPGSYSHPLTEDPVFFVLTEQLRARAVKIFVVVHALLKKGRQRGLPAAEPGSGPFVNSAAKA